MTHSSQRAARVCAATATVLLAALMAFAPARAAAAVNTDPNSVTVYDNNLENLPQPYPTWPAQCDGNYKDLVNWMKNAAPTVPDIFLVQQIGGKSQLDDYTQYLSTQLAGTYAGVIADNTPGSLYATDCPSSNNKKEHQTNAIIYRTGRFTPIASDPSISGYRCAGSSSPTAVCFESLAGSGCPANTQSRTRNILQRFRDDNPANTGPKRNVTVVSLHWPSGNVAPQEQCAKTNAFYAGAYANANPGDLKIFGGDTNYTDWDGLYNKDFSNPHEWYKYANGDTGGALGYRDAAFYYCAIYQASTYQDCLKNSWTGNPDSGPPVRRDFIFARKGDNSLPDVFYQHTVTYAEADAASPGADTSEDTHYSQHRAVVARVKY